MDLSYKVIAQVVHPTAAFSHLTQQDRETDEATSDSTRSSPWSDSILNPKNRIDSFHLPADPLWRIDGCAGLGTQFYMVPLFMSHVPPMRIDVFVPEKQPPTVRRRLDLNVAFHTKDFHRLAKLRIVPYILRAMQWWTTTEFPDLTAFERFYRDIPFGSRLVLDSLASNPRHVRLKPALNYHLEWQLLSLPELKRFWGADFEFPEVVDFFDVHVLRVLHDSVSLVKIQGELYILKALTSGPKFLYHELKTLCTIEPHPNIVSRPVHIVRKACKFGDKKAVLGFTTKYHANGGLRDRLPHLRLGNQLLLEDQIKWSTQLARALEHLQRRSNTYYPDLRLDNIVLSEQMDVIMVDFEQRGVWCEFAAPEVNSIEYMRMVAIDEEVPPEVQDKYLARLRQLAPGFEALELDRYMNPEQGFNTAWIALSQEEQEAAEVYMLGRVIWCIFEGVSGPQRAAVWSSYECESDLEFPEYVRTPPAIRDLVNRCTRGRRRTLSSTVTRGRGQLILQGGSISQQNDDCIREAARTFWAEELAAAEEFLDTREAERLRGERKENYFDRPTLKEVLACLEEFREASLQGGV